MKIILTEEEMRNVVATQSQEDIKLTYEGRFKKWDIQKIEDGYSLEYIYTEKGDLKPKFAKSSKGEEK